MSFFQNLFHDSIPIFLDHPGHHHNLAAAAITLIKAEVLLPLMATFEYI